MELPSEFHPYLPLSHLQICLHGIAIRISPLFALIPPCRYVYMEPPSEFCPYDLGTPLCHDLLQQEKENHIGSGGWSTKEN
jgi:hypothetical protein